MADHNAEHSVRCCPGGWAAGHAYWCVERPAVTPENSPTLTTAPGKPAGGES